MNENKPLTNLLSDNVSLEEIKNEIKKLQIVLEKVSVAELESVIMKKMWPSLDFLEDNQQSLRHLTFYFFDHYSRDEGT